MTGNFATDFLFFPQFPACSRPEPARKRAQEDICKKERRKAEAADEPEEERRHKQEQEPRRRPLEEGALPPHEEEGKGKRRRRLMKNIKPRNFKKSTKKSSNGHKQNQYQTRYYQRNRRWQAQQRRLGRARQARIGQILGVIVDAALYPPQQYALPRLAMQPARNPTRQNCTLCALVEIKHLFACSLL